MPDYFNEALPFVQENAEPNSVDQSTSVLNEKWMRVASEGGKLARSDREGGGAEEMEFKMKWQQRDSFEYLIEQRENNLQYKFSRMFTFNAMQPYN